MIDDLPDHVLLAPLSEREQAQVAALCEERVFPAGELVLEQDAATTGLHLLLDGHVEVTVHLAGSSHDVAVLGPGAVVGELSMLEGQDRSAADVRAIDEVRAAVVPPERAEELLAVDAVALQLDGLARRRRATNRALAVMPVLGGEVEGRALVLRPLWPEDWRQLAAGAGAGRVSDKSLHMRFFNPPPFTERTFRRLTATDHHDQFAWGAFVDDELVGVGRHALQAEDRGVAELALIVADDLQGQGLGGRLVTAIAAAADAHGADELAALARADNEPVRRLLERVGAVWQPGGEDDTVSARWPLAAARAAVADEGLWMGARAVASAVLGDVLDH